MTTFGKTKRSMAQKLISVPPGYPHSQIQSTSHQWRRSWRKRSISRLCARCTSLDTCPGVILQVAMWRRAKRSPWSSPRAWGCCREWPQECTCLGDDHINNHFLKGEFLYHWVRTWQRTQEGCHRRSTFSGTGLKTQNERILFVNFNFTISVKWKTISTWSCVPDPAEPIIAAAHNQAPIP